MAYVHCHHCNAKALAGATRCPRCEASFLETPPRRESEVPRRRTCPTCGDEHMGHDACASCRNRERARAQARATRGVRLGMGIAAAVVIAAFGVRGIASRMSQATPTVARDATGLAAARPDAHGARRGSKSGHSFAASQRRQAATSHE